LYRWSNSLHKLLYIICAQSTFSPFFAFIVITLTLGSRPRQRQGKVQAENATQEPHLHSLGMWRNEPTHSQMDSHFGSWNPFGVLNLQKGISRVKIHWIKKFLTSLKSSWNLDV
jgi:hypothetical protein